MTTAVQLISKLGSVGVKLWLDDKGQLRFKAPKGALTPELKSELVGLKSDVIAFLKEAKGNSLTERIPQLSRDPGQEYALSFAQQRFWFLDRLEPGNPSLHIPATLHITGKLDIECLRQSLTFLAKRHESLRTGFVTDNNNDVHQVIWPTSEWELTENFDLSHLNENDQQSHIQQIAEEEALRPFELHSPNTESHKVPLLRTRLARLTDSEAERPEHILFITMHHIISDGWSIGLLINELTHCYQSLKQNKLPELPALEIHYVDYALWQRKWMQSERMESQLNFWKNQLKGLPVLELPTDFPRPKQTTHHGANHTFTIDSETTQQVRSLALKNKTSVFITLLAAFHILLSRYSNQKDICVGTPVAGRNRQDIENIIGCFINLLAIRSQINTTQVFKDYLNHMQQVVLEAQENQNIPFELVAEECTENRSLAHTPIFQVLFTHQQTDLYQHLQVDDLEIELLSQQSLTAKYDIQLHINEAKSSLEANIEFNTDLFTLDTIKDFSRHFCNLLDSISGNIEKQLGALSIFDQQDLLLLAPPLQFKNNQTDSTLIELFEKNSGSENIAVRCGDNSLTHKQLHRRANTLAHLLLEQGISINHRIGICLHPGIDFMVALLATLKCGASYVPMDANYPTDRLQHMISNAEMSAVITLSSLATGVTNNKLILLDDIELVESNITPNIQCPADQLLYLIYTSGSTGLPKGAGVSHSNELNLLHWYIRHYNISENEKFLVISSIGFDLTQKNLLAPLACGAQIIFSPSSSYDPQVILDTIHGEQVTWINCAPSAFYPIIETSARIKRIKHLSSIKHLLFGGEPIQLENLMPWIDSDCFQAKITNMYGPTECTDITCAYTLDNPKAYSGKPIPIGCAIDGVTTYILDESMQLAPIGTPGELYIGGESVGLGYFQASNSQASSENNTNINETSFIKNPFGEGLIYRTRDVVRSFKSPDGLQLEFLNRIDDQVKIRGFRVELGEIASQLMLLNEIKDALVISNKPENSAQKLIAYYIFEDNQSLDLHSIRNHLKAHLPDYMIPAAFVDIKEWPLSPNGKVDKKALPSPNESHSVQSVYVAPRNLIETQLTELWQQSLKIETIGIHDNFFELGGHSLIATQLVGQIASEFGIDVPLKVFFEKPTIAELSERINQGEDFDQLILQPQIKPVDRSQTIPLSFAQERLWIIEQINPGNSAYNIPLAVKMDGTLNISAFKKALNVVIDRHESLRTCIKNKPDGSAYQAIIDADELTLEETDLSHTADPIAEAKELFNREAATPFIFDGEAASKLLFRAQLVKIATDCHIFIACMHHIISDGWSLTVFQQELVALYQAFSHQLPPPLEPLPYQYADYAVWQREYLNDDHVQQHLDYWLDHLKDAPAFLSLPTDKPRPEQQTFNGAMYTCTIDKQLQQKLDHFSKHLGTTYFNILISTYALLLSKYSNQDDICIGTPVSGREKSSLQHLIGYFVNAVVIRNRLSGNPTVTQLLERAQDAALGAFAHQDVPIEQVLDKLPIERNMSYPPIAQVGFSYISKELSEVANVEGLKIQTMDFEKVVAKYDLTLIIAAQEDNLQLNFEYNIDLFNSNTIEKLAEHFSFLLDSCISAPETGINNISLLTDDALFDAVGVSHDLYEQVLPLTPMQHDMVMAQWLQPDSLANTLGYRAEIDFEVNAELWQQAINLMAGKQRVTRTQFRPNRLKYGEFAYQCILKQIDIALEVIDLSDQNLPPEEIDKRVDDFIYQPQQYTNDQFIRYGLMRLPGERTILLLSSHHALLDGVAIVLIAETTAKYYEALHYQHDLEKIPCLPSAFTEYIKENRLQLDSAKVQAFWQDKLSLCEAPDFPLADFSSSGYQQVVNKLEFSPNLWRPLKAYCRKNRMTPAQLLKLVYCLLIANYCRTDADFFLSEFQAGRNKQNAFSLGCFFLQSPFIFSNSLLQKDTKITELFNYLKNYRKETKPFDSISMGLTRKLAPQGRLHFMFNYYHFFPQNQKLLGHPITCIETPPFIEQTVQFVIKEHEESVSLDLYYQNNCFEDKQFLQRIELICQQLVNGKETIGDLSFLLTNEQQQQLYQWNNADIQPPNSQSIQSLFEAQVEKTPESVAIRDDNGQISYRHLNERANQVAHYLHLHGVGSDVRVGLCLPRSIDALVVIWGIIKAGGAYVPIDTGYPEERINHMITSANIDILFTLDTYGQRLCQYKGSLISIDDIDSEHMQAINNQPASNPVNSTNSQDMLYVIFTSGSTGKPKGATVTHRGEINLLQWYTREFTFNTDTRCLIISALGFDLTQKNLLAPLVTGGQLILSHLEHYDSGAILQLINEHKINLINCAPSAFYPLVEDHNNYDSLQSLQTLIFGGESINTERLADWLESDHCQVELVNNYGPTECTDISSFYRIDDAKAFYNKPVPIGKPNDNVQVFILNSSQQLLPAGLIGEICIGGISVGRGYLHNDDLNHEKFIPNPFGSGQLYRTGDLGRYLPDGNIEFVMREDFQVKLNGLRIEPGEIEYALRQQPGITDALVVINNNQLIAYITCLKEDVSITNWKTSLSRKLAAYMVPQHFVPLEQWPLTPNGKIDREALPAPDQQLPTVDYVAPRDDIEQVICDIVKNILLLDKVGIHDNFFDLGGHSLAASRAIVQIREHFKIDIPLNVLFDMTTVEKLAAYIKASQWAAQSSDDKKVEDENRDTGFI